MFKIVSAHSRFLFGCLVVLLLSTGLCAAQAPIDPTLPEAPLPHRRVLLLFPGFETVQDPTIPVAPLTPKQKFEMAYRKSIDVSLPIEAAMFAGFSQSVNYGPAYGSGWAPYGERVGYYAMSLAATNLFCDGVLPTLLHQDPRYFRKGSGSILSRMWWAARSEAVGFNDQGRETPNVAGMLGFGMSTALSNAITPERQVTFANTMERYGVKEGLSIGLNFVREFGGLSKPEKNQ